MKCKSLLYIIILATLTNPRYVTSFEINKISEFGFSGIYQAGIEGINIQDDYLYAVNRRSFQIFHIEDDYSLSLLSDVNLQCSTYEVIVKNDYAYVSTLYPENVLYRFNIEDKYNPVLTDSLYRNIFSYTFVNNNYVFVHDWDYQHSKTIINIYDNETFDEITQIDAPQNLVMHYLQENIGINRGVECTFLYDISNPDSIQIIAQYNDNTNWGLRSTKLIQDTVLVIGNSAEIEFWDISEPFNWELINIINQAQLSFDISGDRMPIANNNGLHLYDISNIENPIQLDHHLAYTTFCNAISIYDNYIVYWGAGDFGIEIFSIAENTLNHIGNYSMYGYFNQSYLREDKFFVNSICRGIHSFDIYNPYNPQYLNENLGGFLSWLLNGDGNIITISGRPEIEGEWLNIVLEITEEYDLIPLDTLKILANQSFYKEGLGLFLVYNDTLHKYVFNNNNQLEEVATLQVPGAYLGVLEFYGNTAYIIHSDHLWVIRNINTNELELATTIELQDFILAYNKGIYEHYLFISQTWETSKTYIYDIINPEVPIYLFHINKGGIIGIDEENDLLFIGREQCSVYDLTTIENYYLNEIYSFKNWSSSMSITPFKRNSINYIVYLEDTSVSIYEYSTSSIDEEFQQVNDIQFTNYPNPFSTSTTISFSATGLRYATPRQAEFTKNAEINIYNIKGQIVKHFAIRNLQSEINEVVWDGKDENGKHVPSGIYLCELKVGKETIVRKMVLLR